MIPTPVRSPVDIGEFLKLITPTGPIMNVGIKILQKLINFLRSPVKHHGNIKPMVKLTFISDWTNKHYKIDDLI